MPNIVRRDAVAIAKKLENHAPKDREEFQFGISTRNGSKHIIVAVLCNEQRICQFGMCYDRTPHRSHQWVPREIHLSPRQAQDFASCQMTHERYAEILIAKGVIPSPGTVEESDNGENP
jgi:hypothetical protein